MSERYDCSSDIAHWAKINSSHTYNVWAIYFQICQRRCRILPLKLKILFIYLPSDKNTCSKDFDYAFWYSVLLSNFLLFHLENTRRQFPEFESQENMKRKKIPFVSCSCFILVYNSVCSSSFSFAVWFWQK